MIHDLSPKTHEVSSDSDWKEFVGIVLGVEGSLVLSSLSSLQRNQVDFLLSLRPGLQKEPVSDGTVVWRRRFSPNSRYPKEGASVRTSLSTIRIGKVRKTLQELWITPQD